MKSKKIVLVVLILLAVLMCYPVLVLVSGSFMGSQELKEGLAPMILTTAETFVSMKVIPLFPTLKHYIEVLLDSPEFFVMFWNSVKLVICILGLQLVVGVAAAWGFAKHQFPFKKTLFTIYIVLMMMPFQVTMLSNYLVLDQLKLINTHLAIILPAGFSTFPVFIMYRFFCDIPKEVIEAAKIDGAGPLRIFRHIALPIGSAGIISAMVLGFLEYWNLIEQPMTFLNDKSKWPLSLYLPNITLEGAGAAFAASIIGLIPAVLVFLAGQDYLEKGIMASAVKE